MCSGVQDPNGFDNIEMLTEEDKQHPSLRETTQMEIPSSTLHTNRFMLHWYHCTRLIGFGRHLTYSKCLTAFWRDQTGSNGANLSFPVEFGIGDYHVMSGWSSSCRIAPSSLSKTVYICARAPPVTNYKYILSVDSYKKSTQSLISPMSIIITIQ